MNRCVCTCHAAFSAWADGALEGSHLVFILLLCYRLVYSLYIFLGSIAHDERQPLRRSDLSLEDSSECVFAGKVNFQEKHTI